MRKAWLEVKDGMTLTLTLLPAGHAFGLLAVDVSQDGRALVGVGCDSSSRQTMVLWDISQLRYGGQVGTIN